MLLHFQYFFTKVIYQRNYIQQKLPGWQKLVSCNSDDSLLSPGPVWSLDSVLQRTKFTFIKQVIMINEGVTTLLPFYGVISHWRLYSSSVVKYMFLSLGWSLMEYLKARFLGWTSLETPSWTSKYSDGFYCIHFPISTHTFPLLVKCITCFDFQCLFITTCSSGLSSSLTHPFTSRTQPFFKV